MQKPELPKILRHLDSLEMHEDAAGEVPSEINALFPLLAHQKSVHFEAGEKKVHAAKKVGVFFSGGQAPGGHNVVAGLFDALKKLNPEAQLFGFLGGPDGLLKNESLKLNESILNGYINQGGFDLLGSSRTKIEKIEQFQKTAATVKALDLDGLVVIGGDDSNTNAAFLAEYFLKEGIKTRVIGLPKTIDGDLKNEQIAIPFGFDTACKTYAATIGSLARDALSAKKYYYFIKLMGRSASHVVLECALQTHPNMAFIGEEVKEKRLSLQDIVTSICDMIERRAKEGKNYGVILIPEGLLESILEIQTLITELNKILNSDKLKHLEIETMESKEDSKVFIRSLLPLSSQACFDSLTNEIQFQLLQARDPHGNVQVSKIETEQFLIDLCKKELKKRKIEGSYRGSFNPQPIFCGYEGRSCYPSLFDCRYCYALGYTAALLIHAGLTGYIACIENLTQHVENWEVAAIPLLKLMQMEEREGKLKALIQKAFVALEDPLFKQFERNREKWLTVDDYQYPRPIQFYGPQEQQMTLTLELS